MLSWVLEAQPSGVQDFSSLRSLDSAQLHAYFSWAFNATDTDNDSVMRVADTLLLISKSDYGEYVLAQSYDLKSLSLLTAGYWSEALRYQDSALAIRSRNGWHDALGTSYLHLGLFYWNEGELYERGEDFEEAEKSYRIALGYIEKALDEYDIEGDSSKITNATIHLGVAYYMLYEYDRALQILKEASELAIAINDSDELVSVWLNMSNIFAEQEMLDSARLYMKSASNYFKSIGDLRGLSLVLTNTADMTMDNPYQSIEMLKEADSLTTILGDFNDKATIQEHLAFFYEAAGNYEEALAHYRTYQSLKDSLLNRDFKDQELGVRYQTDRYKEQIQRQREESLRQELALQKTAAQRQRLQIILFSLSVLFVLAIGFFYWRRTVMEKLQQQRLVEMEQAKNLETARAMITGQEQERIRIAEDLHDRLGSTLSAAKMQMEAAASRNGTENKYLNKSSELIDRAIGDTREISHNLISGVLVKLGLAAALEDLKESLQVTNKLDVNLEVVNYSGLPRKTELQLFRITQELVNNSVKHAGGSEIRIKLEEKNGTTCLSVADDGPGFDPDKVKSGLGLINIERRIEAISGTIEMQSGASGSHFVVSVPGGNA